MQSSTSLGFIEQATNYPYLDKFTSRRKSLPSRPLWPTRNENQPKFITIWYVLFNTECIVILIYPSLWCTKRSRNCNFFFTRFTASHCSLGIFYLGILRFVSLFYSFHQGHTNWIFGIDFLSDDLLVSGSRDSNINFWRIEKSPSSITRPIKSVKAHIEKTRDVVVCRKKQVILIFL